MSEIMSKKAALFDVLREQAGLHARLRQLDQLKQHQLQELVLLEQQPQKPEQPQEGGGH